MLTPKEQVIFDKTYITGKKEMYQSLFTMLKNGVPLEQILEALDDPEDFQNWFSEQEK